ncbi:MAG: phage tail tape measure protein, partial [Peptostreptococcaceae bacterium]|nr:phage tail tape measure protein [Peptostreptococcaceae bacterium]
MSGWASIVNASEGDFNKLSEAIANSDGVAQSMSDTMMQGMNGALTEMKSALEGVAITIGERLTPFIEKIADEISDLCNWFKNLSPETQTFIMVVAGLLATLGPLLMIIGSAISLFANLSIVAGALNLTVGALCSPFLIAIGVIAGIIAIGYLLVSNWDWIKEKATQLGEIVVNAWNSMCDWISKACSNIGKWISDTWNSVCDWTSSAWDTVCNFVEVGVMLIGEILSAGFQIITLPWQFIWENCKNIIIPIWET